MKLLISFSIVIFWGAFTQAQDIQGWKAEVAKHGQLFKKACGFDIPTKFDAEGFAKTAQFKDPANDCTTVQWAVKNMCEHAEMKALVKRKIKSIHCKPGVSGETAFSIPNGEFDVTFGPKVQNLSEKAVHFLKGALKHQ